MCIFIFILKLIEYLLYREIASGYPAIIVHISNFDCALGISFSLFILITIYFYFRNKVRNKNKILCISIILIIFTIMLTLQIIITFKYSFPINLRISRSIGLLISIITCVLAIRKRGEI